MTNGLLPTGSSDGFYQFMCEHCGGHGNGRSLKLAVTGKGGVGKTTISALMARALHNAGRVVLAIDADPNTTLLGCMGYTPTTPVPPLVELKGLIAERTGTGKDSVGMYFTLNPKVSDLPEQYWLETNGVKLLVLGAITRAGAGN